MPEQPAPRARPVSLSPSAVNAPTHDQQTAFKYAELHCRTNYSFLEGASHPDELIRTAHELGYQALAVTDRNTLAGVDQPAACSTPLPDRLRSVGLHGIQQAVAASPSVAEQNL